MKTHQIFPYFCDLKSNLMKHNIFRLLCLLLLPVLSVAQNNYTQYVNPFVGTDAHGHTFPGALVPFGAVQLSPDTRLSGWDGCSGYHYSDDVVYGFSHTHLSGTGCSDYGDILVMPFSGEGSPVNTRYCSKFSHQRETASPGYYSVQLETPNVLAELTATTHVGCHRYTFANDGQPHGIVIDLAHRDIVLDSYLEVVNNQEITGYRVSRAWSDKQYAHFCMKLSHPAVKVLFFRDSTLLNTNDHTQGGNLKALVYFADTVRQVVLNVGISAVDIAGARANLVETPTFNFDLYRQRANDAWNKELGKIEVKGEENDMRIFYTALYHCFLSPYEFSDLDGRYRGQDDQIHRGDGHKVYTVFSLWDTYRALHPLLNLIDRKRTNDFLNTFLLAYEQGGQLPMWELSAFETWCMIGYHAIPVILDASRKGIGDYDKKKMLEAMVSSARLPKLGRPEFEKYEYIPADKEHESVSKTLEYCFDDWCIYQYASDLGDTFTAYDFYLRCLNYRNIVDKNGFMHPKSNGAFIQPFDPTEVNNHFTEANSWQYSTYVPHDFSNYILQAGGKQRVTEMLDSLFFGSAKMTGREQVDLTGIIGQYAHGNEPGHHAPYLYNYVGQPWKTQQVVRRILSELYTDAPDGLCGNEDCGQMSAWYVMSAMGFYTIAPGSNRYDLGSPIFDEVKMHLENGKTFTIICKNQSKENIYIQEVKKNGKEYHFPWIRYDKIADGDTFELVMGSTPNQEALPYETYSSACGRYYNVAAAIVPVFGSSESVFRDKMTVSIHPGDRYLKKPEQKIYYRTSADGFKKVHRYTKPFTISETTTIKAWTEQSNMLPSAVVEAAYVKFLKDKSIRYISPYNPQYTAGGDDGLIDGIRGNVKWRLGGWQGFQGQDFEAIVDLQAVKEIHSVSVGFLEDVRAWIWFPTELSVEVSEDGEKFIPFGTFKNEGPVDDYTEKVQDFVVKGFAKARYVRVKAKNFGTIPEWHQGAGGEAHIFVDEIVVE